MGAETKSRGKADLIVGLGYGDEGKGKIAELIGTYRRVGIRSQGGANAGHTVYLDFEEFRLTRREGEEDAEGREINTHLIPTTIVNKNSRNLIGPDVWFDPVRAAKEIDYLNVEDFEVTPERLGISDISTLIFPSHIREDRANEESANQMGSTKSGIAFGARDHAMHRDIRTNVILQDNAHEVLFTAAYERLLDLINYDNIDEQQKAEAEEEARAEALEFSEAALRLRPYITDTVRELHELLDQGENVIIEGAQASGLDPRFGKHPYVTSSGTTAPSLLRGAGLNHKDAGTTYGVIKMFPTKVGGGEFSDRIEDPEILEVLRGEEGSVDEERGKTTGRQREIGWLSLPLLRYYIRLNGVDELALTKFDMVSKLAKVATKMCVVVKYQKENDDGTVSEIEEVPSDLSKLAGYTPVTQEFDIWEEDISEVRNREALPERARMFLNFLEQQLDVPIGMIGVGPRSDEIVVRPETLHRLEQSAPN